MKLTADTITDKQIRELRESATDDWQTRCACNIALYDSPAYKAGARARCAEILNARSAK